MTKNNEIRLRQEAKLKPNSKAIRTRAKITNSTEYRQARPLERARIVEEASPRGFAGDLSKALKLRLQGLSNDEIGKLLGVGATTIQDSLKHFDFIETDKDSLGAYVDNELEVFDYIRLLASKAVILQLTDSERSKKLDIMRLNSLLGTVFDKMRLMRGQSTSNISALSKLVLDAHQKRLQTE